MVQFVTLDVQNQIELVGGRVSQIWNVLGHDYDLLFMGEEREEA